jgi:hypothetical protein
MSQRAYQGLCSQFYDLDKPEAPPDEVDFYADAIAAADGQALEAMCGSGRLLIPLLRRRRAGKRPLISV